MPDQPRVLCEVKDHIAYVTMSRHEKHNGLDMAMFRDMISTARKIRKDRGIRCVILSGNGPSFCAGLDFQAVNKDPSIVAKVFLSCPGPNRTLPRRLLIAGETCQSPLFRLSMATALVVGCRLSLRRIIALPERMPVSLLWR